MKLLFLISFILQELCLAGFAKTHEEITVNVDKHEVRIGEPIQLTIRVERPKASQLKDPNIEAHTGKNFKIKNPKIEEKAMDNNKNLSILIYTLTPFQVGTFKLGPIRVQIQEGRSKLRDLEAKAITIIVKSMLDPQMKDPNIRGPKPLLPIRANLTWIYILLAIILGLGVGGWFLARKTSLTGLQMALPLEVPIDPADEAIQKLDDLARSDDLQHRKMNIIYVSLSNILRGYFSKRFLSDFLEMTTSEALRALKRGTVDSKLLENIQNLLNESDLVKFAKAAPDPAQALHQIATAKEVVMKTREASHALQI